MTIGINGMAHVTAKDFNRRELPSSTAAARNTGVLDLSRPVPTREGVAGGRVRIRTVSSARIEQRYETDPFDLLTPHPFASDPRIR